MTSVVLIHTFNNDVADNVNNAVSKQLLLSDKLHLKLSQSYGSFFNNIYNFFYITTAGQQKTPELHEFNLLITQIYYGPRGKPVK